VVRPWPALGLTDDGTYLVDIVGERALVIYPDATFPGPLATGELVLFRGDERESLGKVWLITARHAIAFRYFSLSPDRNHIIWTGPNGTHVADLRSAKIAERSGEYSWSDRAWGSPGLEAGKRVVDWLPDGSGIIEHWHDGDEVSHWEIFEPLGGAPIASGDGRIAGFSPDCTHMLIHNEEARKYLGGFWHPDVPPYTLRPAPIRITPGARRWADWDGDTRHWAVHADSVSYFECGRVSDTETVIYRITSAGSHTFTVDASGRMWVTVLRANDGGRVGAAVHVQDQTAAPEAERRYETIIFDFGGNEKMRLDDYPQAADPDTGVFALVERDGKHNRVKLVNALTGEARLVLECEGAVLRVWLQGSHFVAHADADPKGEGDFDLYVGRVGDGEWTLVARAVQSPRTAP
jgi:hypothetical protein